MTKVQIYHNPRCTKSRQTLTLLRDKGIEPEVIEYLKTPPDEKTIAKLLKYLDVDPSALIRKKEYKALCQAKNLPETDDAQELIRRMAQNPQIIERPIVVSGSKAAIGRPPERVLDIL